MTNKIILLSILMTSVLLQACGQQQELQYGKQPLALDHFDFDLDLDTFFQDESIFGYSNEEGFFVSSEETYLADDALITGYIRYATRSMSPNRPLASYADVQFEELGLVVDWEDENVLMVCAETSYADSEDIMQMIGSLNGEYGTEAVVSKGGFMRDNTLYLTYRKENTIAKLIFDLPDVEFIDWSEAGQGEDKRDIYLREELQETLSGQLKGLEAIECRLFVTQAVMDAVIDDRRGRSGFLVYYK